MAFAKRTSRTIRVDGEEYRWVLSPDDGYMWLIVQHARSQGQRIEAHFNYHDVLTNGDWGKNLGQRRSVSPGAVRAVVLHALSKGWRSQERGLKPFRIDGEAVVPEPPELPVRRGS